MGRDVCWKLEVDFGGCSGLGRARKRFHACSSYPPPHAPVFGLHSSAMTHNHPSDFPSLDTRRQIQKMRKYWDGAERAKGVGSSR